MMKPCLFSLLSWGMLMLSALELPLTHPEVPFAHTRKKEEKVNKSEAVFDAVGKRFLFGSKELQIFPSGYLRFMESGREITRIYFYGNTPYSPWMTNTNTGIKVPCKYKNHLGVDSFSADVKNKTFIVKGKIPYHKKGTKELLGSYQFTATLLKEGKVSLRLELQRPAGRVKDGSMTLMCTTKNASSYIADGKKGSFPVQPGKQNGLYRPGKIRVVTPVKAHEFLLCPVTPATVWARKGSLLAVKAHTPRKDPSRLVSEIILDPLSWEGKRSSGGVDLQKVEALDPALPASRNLLHNPYLAQGLNYIGFHHQLFPWKGCATVKLSGENPKFGENCLLMETTGQHDGAVHVGTVSAVPGPYTFSFYARADKECTVRAYATNHTFKLYGSEYFSVGKEWKRYFLRIRVPSISALQVALGGFIKGKKEAMKLYIDGMQLEKGSVMTAFDSSPVSARLLTSAADDFLPHGKKIHARLRLSTLKEKASGNVNVSVRDMFGTLLYRKKASFRFTKTEYPQIGLDLEGKIPDGVHLVRVEFDTEGKKYTQYFRFSVMPFFKNQHKHKNFFAQNYNGGSVYQDVYPGLEAYIKRSMYLGAGSDVHQPYPTKQLDALCRKYNYEIMDSSLGIRGSAARLKQLFPRTNPLEGHQYSYFYWADNRFLYWQGKGGLLPDYRLVPGFWTGEYRKKAVDTASYIVRKSSPRRIYIMGAEWSDELKNDPHYIDLLLAVREGVKKVYPDSLFGEGGSYNMDAGNGVREIDRTLTRLKGKMPIEIIHTHTYTKDILSLESNFKALVEVVEKKHGCKNVKYFFGEGMHYGPYEIPAWGVESASWNGINSWHAPSPLSYDMGWTEKRSAAWYMRSWLIFMTKINQVLAVNSSVTNMKGGFNMDVQLRSRLYQKVPNTLSMLLGNAKGFVKDVSFAGHTKCLIWEDKENRPVVAVFYQEPAADSGLKQGPWAKAKLPENVEIFDMMGARRSLRKDGLFPVSVFPFFFRGRPGETALYVKIFSEAVLEGDHSLPVHHSALLHSPSEGILTLTNVKAVPLSAGIQMSGGRKDLKLPPLGKVSVLLPLQGEVRYDRIQTVSIPFELTVDGKTLKGNSSFRALAVKRFSGDWKKIPSFEIGGKKSFRRKTSSGKDFSARGQLAFDAENFHIRVTVKDDVFLHKAFPMTGNRWENDSLQIFIDTRCSARKNNTRTFDEDDYAYTLIPEPDGKRAFLFRYRSPDIQLTLGVSAPKDMTAARDVPCSFTRTKDGYIYECSIPARYMLPARLEKNYAMGFALYLNDRDDHGKGVANTLTMTPPGTAPYNRPHFYPVILLTE